MVPFDPKNLTKHAFEKEKICLDAGSKGIFQMGFRTLIYSKLASFPNSLRLGPGRLHPLVSRKNIEKGPPTGDILKKRKKKFRR